MDEVLGGLIGVGLVIALIVWLVGQVLKGLALLFLGITSLFGHPAFVLLFAVVIGAAVGIIMNRRAHGVFVPRSSDDFAQIGRVRLTPEHWAAVVVSGFAALIGILGMSRS